MHIGCSLTRIDAFDKVTGKAQYTDDLCPRNALVARVLHASIANGTVLGFDLAEALQVEGVVKIITCFDVHRPPLRHRYPPLEQGSSAARDRRSALAQSPCTLLRR